MQYSYEITPPTCRAGRRFLLARAYDDAEAEGLEWMARGKTNSPAQSMAESHVQEPNMTITSRLKRIGRLAIAPVKGFFTWETKTKQPTFEPGRTTRWAHMKAMASRDTTLYYEPFTNALRAFREERGRQ